MWRYCGVTQLVLAAMAGTVWSQAYPGGTQDGPCPDISFKKNLQWCRLEGSWTEIMRFKSSFEPNQCPASHTYAANPPNITNFLSPGGSDETFPWQGVIDESNPSRRVFPNIFGPLWFNDIIIGQAEIEIVQETIYTNYRNIHIFQTCFNLDGNKHIEYVWIEAREGKKPSPWKIKTLLRRLEKKGIDTSRFWDLDQSYC